jgi:drug/metabolite transporter (DMT)-like permease
MPVVFIALVSLLLGRGDQIHPLAYPGFAAVTIGCLILPLPSFRSIHLKQYLNRWVIFSLLAAVCITAYTLLDDHALRILRSLQGSALSPLEWSALFVELEALSITFFFVLFLPFWKNERKAIRQADAGEWRAAALTGLVITSTYALVLVAMAYVRDVSYVFAFRQLSIPIGAGLGILLRGEPASPPKLTGIALVVLGLIMAGLG